MFKNSFNVFFLHFDALHWYTTSPGWGLRAKIGPIKQKTKGEWQYYKKTRPRGRVTSKPKEILSSTLSGKRARRLWRSTAPYFLDLPATPVQRLTRPASIPNRSRTRPIVVFTISSIEPGRP